MQASWTNASKKQREKLLELIRRLAEDDKDGVMAHKVLNLLWNLAHSDDVPVDIMDQALSAHIKILDYSCSQVHVKVLFVNMLKGNAIQDNQFSAHLTQILDLFTHRIGTHRRFNGLIAS